MKRRTFISSGFAGVGAALLAGRANAQNSKPPQAENVKPTAAPGNPFMVEGNWYKAALHVHTTTSDGDVDVATRLKQYREAGFQIVAVTDHWKTNDLAGYGDDHFLTISGMEMHPKTGTGAPSHHFVVLDLPHPLELDKKQPAQEMIDTVKRVGGMVIYAHPHWTAHTILEMKEVSGYVGIEVFNGVCTGNAKGYSQAHADQLFNKGVLVGLLATDDIHRSHQVGMGWTMIRTKKLDKASVMEALRSGNYYASCGPVIEDFRIENGVLRVKVSPVSEIHFLCDGAGGGRRHVRQQEKQPLTSASWKLEKGPKQKKWVYCEVIDAEGRHAWTNPIVI